MGRVEVADDVGDVFDTKQFMAVEELALAIVRKIRGENAVRSAFFTMVFASSASVGAVTVTNSPWHAHSGGWGLLPSFPPDDFEMVGSFPPCDSLFFLPLFWRRWREKEREKRERG